MADYDDIAIPAPGAASDTRWPSADTQRGGSHIGGRPPDPPREEHPSQRMLPSAARLREIALLNGIALTPPDDPPPDDLIEAEQPQARALRRPYFGPLQVIRRQIPQKTYFGAGPWRRMRHTTRQVLAAAHSGGAAFWAGVCLLPGDLRSATADAVGGGGAALRRMRGSAIWKRTDQRRLVAALAALAIAVAASLLIPLDQMWSQWMRTPSGSSSIDAAARQARIEHIKDAALASQPATAVTTFEPVLTPRHRDHGRFADALRAARHPVLELTPTLKPTTRPVPATPVALERLWRDKVAAAAIAGPGSATATAAAANHADEMSTTPKKPPELPAKTDREDQDSTGWIFDWVHGDGVQNRVPRARGARRSQRMRRHP